MISLGDRCVDIAICAIYNAFLFLNKHKQARI